MQAFKEELKKKDELEEAKVKEYARKRDQMEELRKAKEA